MEMETILFRVDCAVKRKNTEEIVVVPSRLFKHPMALTHWMEKEFPNVIYTIRTVGSELDLIEDTQ